MIDQDISQTLAAQIKQATREKYQRFIIQGNNTKSFLGNKVVGEILNISPHRGIINYEPSELIITARAGTPLREIEQLLAENNQMLGFEPPYYNDNATLGGTIACGLSGPRRAYAGAARDFVLGCRIINGKGEILHFGGEVMKNVAGYDVSRLMTGAMGTLGILLDISLKVIPKPPKELTITQVCSMADAIKEMYKLSLTPLPISATAYIDDTLYIRLSGSPFNLSASQKKIKGDLVSLPEFWQNLKEQQLDVFSRSHHKNTWRFSIASDFPPINLPGKWVYEWGGALRWLITDEKLPSKQIYDIATEAGGHAYLHRRANGVYSIYNDTHEFVINRYQTMSAGVHKLNKRLKDAFDPHHLFNIGKMYADI